MCVFVHRLVPQASQVARNNSDMHVHFFVLSLGLAADLALASGGLAFWSARWRAFTNRACVAWPGKAHSSSSSTRTDSEKNLDRTHRFFDLLCSLAQGRKQWGGSVSEHSRNFESCISPPRLHSAFL